MVFGVVAAWVGGRIDMKIMGIRTGELTMPTGYCAGGLRVFTPSLGLLWLLPFSSLTGKKIKKFLTVSLTGAT